MDAFFSQKTCDRCGGDLTGGRTMSMFNTECICMKCKEAEVHEAGYKEARDAEMEQVKAGNLWFKGVGRK